MYATKDKVSEVLKKYPAINYEISEHIDRTQLSAEAPYLSMALDIHDDIRKIPGIFRAGELEGHISFPGGDLALCYAGYSASFLSSPKCSSYELAHEARDFNLLLGCFRDISIKYSEWLWFMFIDPKTKVVVASLTEGEVSVHQRSKELFEALTDHYLGKRVIKIKTENPKTKETSLDSKF